MARRRRYTSNEALARAIDEGLKHIREEHNIFVARWSERQFCGCALVIAMAGVVHLPPDKDLPNSCIPIDDSLVGFVNREIEDAVALFAQQLGIPESLAHRIDLLHRQDRIPAMEIAAMLRRNEI